MSYTFNGSTQYLNSGPGDLVGAWPVSIFAMGNSSVDTTLEALAYYQQNVLPRNGLALYMDGLTAGDHYVFSRFQSTTIYSTNAFTANVWGSVIGRGTNDTTFDIYSDDAATTGTGTTAWPGTGPGDLTIGGRLLPALTNPFTGAVAKVAVWNAVLSDDECHALTIGFSPRRIRPQSLKLYAPIVRELHYWVGSASPLVATASPTVTDQPRSYGF